MQSVYITIDLRILITLLKVGIYRHFLYYSWFVFSTPIGVQRWCNI